MKRSAVFANLAQASLAILLAACGTNPPAPLVPPDALDEPPVRPVPRASSAPDFERRLREQALAQLSQSKLAEAAMSWEILTALRPDEAEYRTRLIETRRLINQQVTGHLERGAQAFKRGALDDAEQHYLTALGLQPDDAASADALRDLERERMRRQVLGRPARMAQSPRAPKIVRPVTSPASGPGLDD